MGQNWKNASTLMVELYELATPEAIALVFRTRSNTKGYYATIEDVHSVQCNEECFASLADAQSWAEQQLDTSAVPLLERWVG